MKTYFVLSFGLFTVLCAALTVNWYLVSQREHLWTVVAAPLIGTGVVLTLWSAWMTVVALREAPHAED